MDYIIYISLLAYKYYDFTITFLVLANCGALTANIIIIRNWITMRKTREAKKIIKIKKYRSTKMGRLYTKAKDEERRMKRRITDRLRRAKKREAVDNTVKFKLVA